MDVRWTFMMVEKGFPMSTITEGRGSSVSSERAHHFLQRITTLIDTWKLSRQGFTIDAGESFRTLTRHDHVKGSIYPKSPHSFFALVSNPVQQGEFDVSSKSVSIEVSRRWDSSSLSLQTHSLRLAIMASLRMDQWNSFIGARKWKNSMVINFFFIE